MNPPPLQALVERLAADVRSETCQTGESGSSPVSRYLSEDQFAAERRALFLSQPVILAHASELEGPGSCLRHDALGVPLLLTRDASGHVHGFLNVCRHRGMRLVEQVSCSRKTLVCPYHGWTYELDGRLRHVPHPEFFEGVVEPGSASHDLVAVPVEERAGLVWGVATPGAKLDLDAYLGSIGEDFEFFGLDDAVVYRRADCTRACNWKLIIEAFLEAYHIRVLHRNSVYPFFLDSSAVSEAVGLHVRSAAARRRITETASLPPEQWDLREHCTFTHHVFPNTVFIFHPDYASMMSLYPQAPDRVRWVHTMLIPREKATPDWEPHWAKSFDLIENGVFQAEDLHACEGIQAGLASGANERLTFGKLEFSLADLHRKVDAAIGH